MRYLHSINWCVITRDEVWGLVRAFLMSSNLVEGAYNRDVFYASLLHPVSTAILMCSIRN